MTSGLPLVVFFFAFLLVGTRSSAAATTLDERMDRLAEERGCTLCHAAEAAAQQGDGVLPPAPSWSEIAARYRGQKGALDKLVNVVIHGSGPENRHWQYKASDAAMPANRVEISEQEARQLVRWILDHS